MAEDPKLVAESRTKLGSAECRRLRLRQRVPGNVYGHGEGTVAIAVSEDDLSAIVHSGHKVVDLAVDGGVQKAILREIQWDTFGKSLLHFDLQRVSADELVTTEVAVETHGTAPGVIAGGMLEILLYNVRIECPAVAIPEKFLVNINSLELDQTVSVRDLELPEKVRVLHEEDEIVLQVVHPTVIPEPEEEAAAAEATEPEPVESEGEQAAE